MIRRRLIRCEKCHRETAVRYEEGTPEVIVKRAIRHAHRVASALCKVDPRRLKKVSDEPTNDEV